jgi:hypothetical protein
MHMDINNNVSALLTLIFVAAINHFEILTYKIYMCMYVWEI